MQIYRLANLISQKPDISPNRAKFAEKNETKIEI